VSFVGWSSCGHQQRPFLPMAHESCQFFERRVSQEIRRPDQHFFQHKEGFELKILGQVFLWMCCFMHGTTYFVAVPTILDYSSRIQGRSEDTFHGCVCRHWRPTTTRRPGLIHGISIWEFQGISREWTLNAFLIGIAPCELWVLCTTLAFPVLLLRHFCELGIVTALVWICWI
jgi:hypothetical protein